MSTEYQVYAELKHKDKWVLLSPTFCDQIRPIYEACSSFTQTWRKLMSCATMKGDTSECSEGIRKIIDECKALYDNEDEAKSYLQHSLIAVNYADAVSTCIGANKYKYCGYVLKREKSAWNMDEIDDFSFWLNEKEYMLLDNEEKLHYEWFEWNDWDAPNAIMSEIASRVECLKALIAGIEVEKPYNYLFDINDSQIRLWVLMG